LSQGIAEFWVHKATADPQLPESYDIANIVGPDEYGIGFPLYSGVTNNPYTNVAAREAILFALEAAREANVTLPPKSLLASRGAAIAAGLKVLFDAETRTHPEYAGFPAKNRYNRGKVKQADVTMLGYPLSLNMSKSVQEADLRRYEALYDAGGPAMTYSIETIAWLMVGNRAKAEANFNLSCRNMQPPFYVWTESPDPDQHASLKDMGCYHFNTGAGGWLQSVIYGYGGMRIQSDGVSFAPTLPAKTTNMKLRGLVYLGSLYDVGINATTVSLCVDTFGAHPLGVIVGSRAFPLSPAARCAWAPVGAGLWLRPQQPGL